MNEVRFWAEYFAHAPSPEERIEVAIARVEAMYVNSHRDTKKYTQPFPVTEFLTFAKAFDPVAQAAKSSRYSDADRAMLAGLMR